MNNGDYLDCFTDIRQPAHYIEGRKYEPRKVINDWKLPYNLACVVKYVSRAGRKDGEPYLKDLYKAYDYLVDEIRMEMDRLNDSNITTDNIKELDRQRAKLYGFDSQDVPDQDR